jgi:hypothetical protein
VRVLGWFIAIRTETLKLTDLFAVVGIPAGLVVALLLLDRGFGERK